MPLFDTDSFETWTAAGGADAAARGAQAFRAALERYETPPLDPGVDAALLDYVARRRTEIDPAAFQ